ncbi:oxygen-regulated protein 1 [Pangasianodon hypophthalmus]|uniref:oxygen-regulated protein 1 n=1 Tax=Pangasianodon hypophthalmus TaxID=310915 RepID=UPI002307E55A|nr:oxygen-regulated protein 1 [Pangasianodon hypophthalmus]
MNTTPHHDPQHPDVFLGSTQTPPSRPLLASKDSKRVCFYKSGDPQFSGHWVVINSRTFKTFDALLDALSNKVPLPFGVRTITTPKGTHTIRSLDDLRHGASYVCSDQRKVKPLNLDEINRRHVPWNSTRPTSAGRQGRRGLIRQLVKKNEVGWMAKMAESSVTVRTPKRLVVFKNRDPSTKRIVVLQRRTAPTFEALLEYLSQVMQFSVVKLYTADGRRVEGLPALILCSGVIVAAGNEPFQLANFNLQASTQPSHSVISETTGPTKTQPLPQVQQKSVSSRPRSRNFSLSSERYFVNQINMSLNGSHSEDNEVKIGSMVSVNNQALESEEMEKCDFMSGIEEQDRLIIPSDDEIEKSFRVNQDGSMTVEMKVHLTIKQEEMIHWTTTVSRTCVNSQDMAAFSQPVSSYNSPDNKDNNNRKRESNIDNYESKDENTKTYKPINLNKEGDNHCGNTITEALEKPKPRFRRLPTPGPRRVRRKETSMENIKRLSQTEVQESTAGTYSYVEHTAEGELLEGYCVVSHSSSSSTRPVPKPRKKNLGESKHNKTHSSLSGMAEVLQLHNKGKEITETVMHIHQSQDTYENYFAKTWADKDDRFEFMSQEHKKPDSTESGPQSSSNGCDTDLTKPSASSGSGNARNKELLSLLSGQTDLSQTISSSASSFTNYETQARCEPSDKGVETSTKEDSENKRVPSKKTKKAQKSGRSNKRVFLQSTVTDKKQKGSVPDFLKDLKNSDSPESQSCTESDKYGQKVKKRKEGRSPQKVNACHGNMLRDTSQYINLGHTHMLRPHMKEKLDIIPSSHSAPFKILTKQRSVNGSVTKSPKESKELSESISMPVLNSSPCNVHQYVENWLEKIHPESVPYMDELNSHEARARFQIESEFSDISEMRSELDNSLVENCASVAGSTVKKPVSRLVQIRYEGEPVEAKNPRRSWKSMPSVRIHAAEQEIGTRKNKSSEDLVPKLPDAGGETSPNTQLNPRSGMKQVLEQLCLSIQFIRKACSHSHLSSLKKKQKSSSLPDFSSQLASVFGSPSEALLSFLTLMTLRDGIANSANEVSDSANANNSGSNPEALQVMQSIQKLASIEDEEELKASLASLHSSTSAQLKKSWRDFQEKNNIKESPPLSPRQSEQEFALEVNSEEEAQDKGHIFGIREIMDELNMCEDLRREISSLVRGDLTNFNKARPTMEHFGHENETTNIACENEDATMQDDLWGYLEEERRYLEERESQYDFITNTKPADLAKESEELHLLKSISHKPALLSKEPAMEESDIRKNVQIEDMSNQNGLVAYITEIVDDVKTNQERYVDNEPSKADLCEEKQEMMDNVQMIEEKYTEVEISQVDEFQVPDNSITNLEDKVEWQENVGCMQSESELLSPTSEIEAKDVREVIDNIVSKMGDCTEGCGINSKEEDTYSETREYPKQPDIMSVASETETEEAHHPNNGTIQTEEKNAIHKEASDFSVDEADPHSNDNNGLKDDMTNNDREETMCSISECENPAAEQDHSSVSDQEDEHSDHYKSATCTWQESEIQHELQKSEEEIVTEKQTDNASENDEEADEDEDFDAEPISSLQLHQEGEYSDHSESYKGQEVVAELDLQTLEEKSVGKNPTHPAEEKDDETDEHDDKQSNALDTDKDLDTQSHHCYLEDPSVKDFLRRESCKSEEKHKAQSEDSAGIEEADVDHDCHCVHPTVFPQQLLDFVNLALMSSALIFTYDSNGCLRIEPDRCKNRAMALCKSNVDNQYARRCLPSPNTSDLSDYRPDTSDSGGDLSQVSTDLLTEGGEDEAERLFIYQGNMKQSSENINRKVKTLDNGSKIPHLDTKQIANPNLKRINSLSSFPDSMVNNTMQDPVYHNSSDSIGNSELAQCLAFDAKADSGEGILIDKGRWLLKENHLIRKSPPVPMAMYENVDTTSVDTGQENTSEEAPYIPCGRKQSPRAVISSSELEDMAKPSTPKCTYFNMAHSSDSDPFLDNQSITSNKGRGFTRKSKEVSPLGETSKMLAKKNGSLPSFASVEFKLAAGKVHPEDGMASSVVEKSARSQSLRCNTSHEEESVEGLSLRCGQHCPIL